MQTGLQARAHLGYYSEREFDFAPFEDRRPQILELGRACIHRQHRNFAVLNLLWKGIAAYAQDHGARFLVGCSSLTSVEDAVGAAALQQLAGHLAPAGLADAAAPGLRLRGWRSRRRAKAVPIPRLLSAYLALGAAICGPPAIDRDFRTIDFLTWIDVESPRLKAIQRRGRFTA